MTQCTIIFERDESADGWIAYVKEWNHVSAFGATQAEAAKSLWEDICHINSPSNIFQQ
jgi:predicted RNase H-like HicB family nuclease